MPEVPELPPFDARTFTTRLHERVLKGEGYVEVPDATGAVKRYPVVNTSGRYAAFDPAGPAAFDDFVIGLRGQQDVLERHEVQLNGADGLKEHIDRLDARERAHHAGQDARLDALEAAHRPFGSGSG